MDECKYTTGDIVSVIEIEKNPCVPKCNSKLSVVTKVSITDNCVYSLQLLKKCNVRAYERCYAIDDMNYATIDDIL